MRKPSFFQLKQRTEEGRTKDDKDKSSFSLILRSPILYVINSALTISYIVRPRRNSLPGVAPVHLPSANVTPPWTMLYLYPSAHCTHRHSPAGKQKSCKFFAKKD